MLLACSAKRKPLPTFEYLDIRLVFEPFAVGRVCEELQGGVFLHPCAQLLCDHVGFLPLLPLFHCGAHSEWGWLPAFVQFLFGCTAVGVVL